MQAYRPKSLDELIGCDDVKDTIRVALSASIAKNDSFPHTLICGGPGLGKTTIAKVIAAERGTEFKELLANVIKTKSDVKNLLSSLCFDGYGDNGVVTGKLKPTIVFLDEIHMLDKKVQEAFFQAMEDFSYSADKRNPSNGSIVKHTYWVPRFTLIGATTKMGMLDRAFIERFRLKFDLNPYSNDELIKIAKIHAQKLMYPVNDEALNSIAMRSRGIARRSINFLDRAFDTMLSMRQSLIDKEITEKTFKLLRVDSLGLESTDIQVLKCLYTIYPQKVGIARLANILNVGEVALKEIVEPYLLREGLIDATPGGRMITEKGMSYCEKTGIIVNDTPQDAAIRRISHA